MTSPHQTRGRWIGGLLLLALVVFGTRTVLEDQKREQANLLALEEQLPFYPLRSCIVTGTDLLSEQMIFEIYRGRLLLLSGPEAAREFQLTPRIYVDLLDQAVIEAQTPDYPLTVCIVSGEPLSAVQNPIDRVKSHRLVRLCCNNCVSEFDLQATEHLAELDLEYLQQQRQAAGEGLHTCPVTGVLLGPGSVEFLWGTRRICVADETARMLFRENPWRYTD